VSSRSVAGAELIAGISSDPQFENLSSWNGGIFTESCAMSACGCHHRRRDRGGNARRAARSECAGRRARPAAGGPGRIGKGIDGVGDIALDLGDRLVELDINPLFALPVGALAGTL